MKKRFGLDAKLIKGKSGVFEVSLDDELIYSKKTLGRFPESGEVEKIVADQLD